MSKTIFVTGAASGIGKATCLLFGNKGWRVGCYDVDVDGARRVAEQLPDAAHGRIDVTNEDFARLEIVSERAGKKSVVPQLGDALQSVSRYWR